MEKILIPDDQHNVPARRFPGGLKPGGSFCLVVGLLLLSSVAAARQEIPRAGARKMDAEERLRQKMEAYKDAEKAREGYKAWSSQIQWSISDPFLDITSHVAGNIKVCQTEDDENILWWAVKESTDPQGRNMMSSSRSLYQGAKLRETYEPKRGAKTIYEYNTAALHYYLPQMLIRDGLNRNMEQIFDVEIIANARYMKSEPDAGDWKAIGFNNREEFETWWKNKKVAKLNTKTGRLEETGSGMTENRPFAKKEDKFDRMNSRNRPLEETTDAHHRKYYIIRLRPKLPAMQRRLKSICMTLRPEDFLPISLMFEYSADRHRNIRFEMIRKDPEPEITPDQFTLDTEGYRIVQR